LLPVLEIGRTVKAYLVIVRQRNRHNPTFTGIRPEHVRITEIGHTQVQYWIAPIFCPGAALVIAESEVLRLQPFAGLCLRRVAGVNRHQARLSTIAEAAAVSLINNRTAGENHDAAFFG
jgi:hypothetical protein